MCTSHRRVSTLVFPFPQALFAPVLPRGADAPMNGRAESANVLQTDGKKTGSERKGNAVRRLPQGAHEQDGPGGDAPREQPSADGRHERKLRAHEQEGPEARTVKCQHCLE